ncbi:MAG: HAMP domain-containing protein [Planctomycetes bacterium]|nr:HAMP domain-containing protein [Planctomycetota bacterium]
MSDEVSVDRPPVLRSLLVPVAVAAALGPLLAEWIAHSLGDTIGTVAAHALAVAVPTALVGALLWVLVLRRIRRLNRALREVAAGDLHRHLRSRASDEIGELTHSLNDLIRTLRTNYDDLKKNDELRRRLIANVSHELRTPLTSMQGYLETAKLAGPESPDLAKNLEVCHRETRRLTRLVKDLFELSKLDTHQLEFHFETVSLVELADQVGLAFEQRMADKKIVFETELPEHDPLEVTADGNRLGQVITNLLGNASVFTPEGGRVVLSCERVGEQAVCRVSDTGIGIGEKDLPHIFESFFHLEKSRTRNLGGTGLGLAICKAIVAEHGGTMHVESRVGEGTTFSFRVALAHPFDEGEERGARHAS